MTPEQKEYMGELELDIEYLQKLLAVQEYGKSTERDRTKHAINSLQTLLDLYPTLCEIDEKGKDAPMMHELRDNATQVQMAKNHIEYTGNILDVADFKETIKRDTEITGKSMVFYETLINARPKIRKAVG